MGNDCGKLPSRISFDYFNGNDKAYLEALYTIFKRDFVDNELKYGGKPVDIIHEAFFAGKERSFWHLVSEGGADPDRTVYNIRSSYIPYVKALIVDDQMDCPDYCMWVKYHDKTKRNRHYIWCKRESYLVILEDRNSHYKLITAYPVDPCKVRGYEKDYARYKTKSPITGMDEISAPSTLG